MSRHILDPAAIDPGVRVHIPGHPENEIQTPHEFVTEFGEDHPSGDGTVIVDTAELDPGGTWTHDGAADEIRDLAAVVAQHPLYIPPPPPPGGSPVVETHPNTDVRKFSNGPEDFTADKVTAWNGPVFHQSIPLLGNPGWIWHRTGGHGNSWNNCTIGASWYPMTRTMGEWELLTPTISESDAKAAVDDRYFSVDSTTGLRRGRSVHTYASQGAVPAGMIDGDPYHLMNRGAPYPSDSSRARYEDTTLYNLATGEETPHYTGEVVDKYAHFIAVDDGFLAVGESLYHVAVYPGPTIAARKIRNASWSSVYSKAAAYDPNRDIVAQIGQGKCRLWHLERDSVGQITDATKEDVTLTGWTDVYQGSQLGVCWNPQAHRIAIYNGHANCVGALDLGTLNIDHHQVTGTFTPNAKPPRIYQRFGYAERVGWYWYGDYSLDLQTVETLGPVIPGAPV